MVRTGSRSIAARIAVALLAVAASAGALGFTLWRASPSAGLTAVTPQDLVASVLNATAADPTISGEVATHVDLGLPDLSQLPVQSSSGAGVIGLLESISGDHTLRVWHSGDNLRVSDLLPAAERSTILSEDAAWAWDSQTFTAYRLPPLPQPPADAGTLPNVPTPPVPVDPETLAQRALSAIEPTTSVSLGANTQVAGRDTYTLIIEPKTSETLVGRIEIDIDTQQDLPLRVAVYARGTQTPAITTEFTRVSFEPLDPSVFAFSPPPGAKIEQVSLPQESPATKPRGSVPGKDARVFGSGWSTVVAVRIPSIADVQKQLGADVSSFLPYSGSLVSATLVDRGDHAWLIAGSVPQSSLVRVEPELT
jgi:outer membrane lipoprotein-sorting protein